MDKSTTVMGEVQRENKSFFPFKMDGKDDSEFIFNIFRGFESFDVSMDKFSYFVEITPIVTESFSFFIESKIKKKFFDVFLAANFWKYMFNFKIQKNRKGEGNKYYLDKLNENLFEVKSFMLMQSSSKDAAEGKLRAIYNNFETFKNYPLNKSNLRLHKDFDIKKVKNGV